MRKISGKEENKMKTFDNGKIFGKRFIDIKKDEAIIRDRRKVISTLQTRNIKKIYLSKQDVYFSYTGYPVTDTTNLSVAGFEFKPEDQSAMKKALEVMEIPIELTEQTFESLQQEDKKKAIKKRDDENYQRYLDKKEARTKPDIVKCPKCESLDLGIIGDDKKGFSVGKAIGGTILSGGVGALAGFIGTSGKHNLWRCRNCGNEFETKK